MATDIEELSSRIQREIATATRLHPPQVIEAPLSFPFRILPVVNRLNGRIIQQRPRKTTHNLLRALDARYMREEFLRLKHRDADLCAFLDHFGCWDNRRAIPVDDFWEFQDWLRLVLRGSKKFRALQLSQRGLGGLLPGSLAQKFAISFDWKMGAPLFTVETNCCADAIVATLMIDVIRDTKFKMCKRRGCPVMFAIGKHNRRFCSQACQHLALVRRSRKEKKLGVKGARIRKAAPSGGFIVQGNFAPIVRVSD
jgi:hypothetical protein